MNMQVENGLTCLRAAVDHGAPTVETLPTSYLGGHQKQMAQQQLILRTGLSQLGDGLAWNH
jgi:hypothetical protein